MITYFFIHIFLLTSTKIKNRLKKLGKKSFKKTLKILYVNFFNFYPTNFPFILYKAAIKHLITHFFVQIKASICHYIQKILLAREAIFFAHVHRFFVFKLPFRGRHQSSKYPDNGEEWQERTVFVIFFIKNRKFLVVFLEKKERRRVAVENFDRNSLDFKRI